MIDPYDFNVAVGGNITGAALGGLLADNSITIQTASAPTASATNLIGSAGSNGDITIADTVSWASANTLTLNAHRNIVINSAITATNSGGKLVLWYGQGAAASGNTATYSIGALVNLQAGQNFSTKLGSDGVAKDFQVVTLPADIIPNASGNIALGTNIVLSEVLTASPIASYGHTFNGLGHTLSNFGIDSSIESSNVGLIGTLQSTGVVRDLHLSNISVSNTFGSNVGGLVGSNGGTISNVYLSSGNVRGLDNVGGLAGMNSGTIRDSSASGYVYAAGNYSGALIGAGNLDLVTNSTGTGTVENAITRAAQAVAAAAAAAAVQAEAAARAAEAAAQAEAAARAAEAAAQDARAAAAFREILNAAVSEAEKAVADAIAFSTEELASIPTGSTAESEGFMAASKTAIAATEAAAKAVAAAVALGSPEAIMAARTAVFVATKSVEVAVIISEMGAIANIADTAEDAAKTANKGLTAATAGASASTAASTKLAILTSQVAVAKSTNATEIAGAAIMAANLAVEKAIKMGTLEEAEKATLLVQEATKALEAANLLAAAAEDATAFAVAQIAEAATETLVVKTAAQVVTTAVISFIRVATTSPAEDKSAAPTATANSEASTKTDESKTNKEEDKNKAEALIAVAVNNVADLTKQIVKENPIKVEQPKARTLQCI